MHGVGTSWRRLVLGLILWCDQAAVRYGGRWPRPVRAFADLGGGDQPASADQRLTDRAARALAGAGQAPARWPRPGTADRRGTPRRLPAGFPGADPAPAGVELRVGPGSDRRHRSAAGRHRARPPVDPSGRDARDGAVAAAGTATRN